MHLFRQALAHREQLQVFGEWNVSALHSPPSLASHARGKVIIQEPELGFFWVQLSELSLCSAAEEKHWEVRGQLPRALEPKTWWITKQASLVYLLKGRRSCNLEKPTTAPRSQQSVEPTRRF